MPKNLLPEFENIIEAATKWGPLIAGVILLLTFESGNRLASYFFIPIFCVLLDRFLWRNVRHKIFAILSVLIVTIASAGWIGVNAWGFEVRPAGVWPDRPGELLFLVARFSDQGTKRINPTPTIVNGLETAIGDAKLNARVTVVSAITNDDPVKAEAEARRKGQIHGAIFIIWGWYDDSGFSPNFTITKRTTRQLQAPKLAVVSTVTPAQLDHFSLYIHDGIAAQMEYFATFTLGQLYFEDAKYDEALGMFNDAEAQLNQSRKDDIPLTSMATLYFDRG